MRRYNVEHITAEQYRRLHLLVKLGRAEAHIVVKTTRVWPVEISLSPRDSLHRIPADAIN